MTYKDKMKAFASKSAIDAFRGKTPIEELPLRLEFGSSSHHPDNKTGIGTSDLALWCKFYNSEWFRPYGRFDKNQIEAMVGVCTNDVQVNALFELLSATKD